MLMTTHFRAALAAPAAHRGLLTIAVGIVSLFVFSLASAVTALSTTGDEPHYLIDARSIVVDGDRDLTDEYSSAEEVLRVYRFPDIAPHAYHYGPSDRITSVHGVGLSLLLTPTALCADGERCGRTVMLLLSSVNAVLLLLLLLRIRGLPVWCVWAAWAGTVLTPTWLMYTDQIYPEIPGVTALLGAGVLLASPSWGIGKAVGAAALAAILPWLHVRFTVLGAAVLGLVVLRTLFDALPVSPKRRTAAQWWQQARSCKLLTNRVVVQTSVAASALYVVSVGALLAAFWHWYGRPSPGAPYTEALDFEQEVSLVLSNVPRYFLGGLFDERLGWLPFAPLHLAALCAVLVSIRRLPWTTSYVGLGLLGYVVIVAASGVSPGGVLPGRYVVVAMPLLAVPLALALAGSRAMRVAAAVAAAASLALLWTFLRVPEAFYARPLDAPPASAEQPQLARVAALWPDIDIRVGVTEPAQQVFVGLVLLLVLVIVNLLVAEAWERFWPEGQVDARDAEGGGRMGVIASSGDAGLQPDGKA
jgi:hypothetical protein